MRARLADEIAILLLAVQFLTRLPVPGAGLYTPERFAATPRWYPVVGALIGLMTGSVFWLAVQVFPPLLAATLSTAAGILLTGAFHEDGFADACDGLGGGATRERALEIMRDSRLGTYGVAGLGLILATKILALSAVPAAAVPALLVAAHAASRASAVLVIATSTYVRDHGTGKPVATGMAAGSLAFALFCVLAAALPAGSMLPAVALAGGLLGLIVGHWTMRRRFEPRLGGYTGDCLGAVQQTSEIGFLLGVLACL
jgi:adenosylcobinamide-GDP ribazoletransferase